MLRNSNNRVIKHGKVLVYISVGDMASCCQLEIKQAAERVAQMQCTCIASCLLACAVTSAMVLQSAEGMYLRFRYCDTVDVPLRFFDQVSYVSSSARLTVIGCHTILHILGQSMLSRRIHWLLITSKHAIKPTRNVASLFAIQTRPAGPGQALALALHH